MQASDVGLDALAESLILRRRHLGQPHPRYRYAVLGMHGAGRRRHRQTRHDQPSTHCIVLVHGATPHYRGAPGRGIAVGSAVAIAHSYSGPVRPAKNVADFRVVSPKRNNARAVHAVAQGYEDAARRRTRWQARSARASSAASRQGHGSSIRAIESTAVQSF